jgi:putative nucleotidyltransferase-like protein
LPTPGPDARETSIQAFYRRSFYIAHRCGAESDQETDVSQLITLFKALAQGQRDAKLATFDESLVRWAIMTGLGPALFHVTQTDAQAPFSPQWLLLKGADLTARVIKSEELDAVSEIIDASEGRVHALTLLKGISICDQHYPEPHLRLMRDIDFWVEESELSRVEMLLRKLGYSQPSTSADRFYNSHHHTDPFLHRSKCIWVEVHRGLFSPKTKVSGDKLFGVENVKAEIRPSQFQGRSVNRLSNELQIAYIASHWASEFNVVGGMVAFLDMIFLLRNSGEQVNWRQILKWLEGSIASTHLYLLLSYLAKYRIFHVAPSVLDSLQRMQGPLINLTFGMMQRLIDRYVVAGQGFGRILSDRNLTILWKTLASRPSPSRNLLLIPWNLLMPNRLRNV